MVSDADLQELIDRARIADTIYAYCDYVDNGDVEAVVGLFAENGVLDLGGGALHRGHAELRDLLIDRFQLYTTTSFHSGGVRMVRYTPTSVSTSTYLYGIHDAKDAEMQMHLWGRFEDELVNQSGNWLFRRRHLRVAGLSHQAPAEVPRRFNRITHAPQPEHVDEPVLRVLHHSDSAHDKGGLRR